MGTFNSGKKIEAFNGITSATVRFMGDTHEGMSGLRNAVEVIKLPLFDKIYNGVADTLNGFNNFAENLSDEVNKIALSYAERPGFGTQAKLGFEECATQSNTIKGAITQELTVDLSDGLHENVSEETVGAFVKSLQAVLGSRDAYLTYVATAVAENTEADTADIYQNIGAGVERITNGFARLFNEYATELKKFNISLEDIQATIKTKANNITEAGAATAQIMESFDNGLV